MLKIGITIGKFMPLHKGHELMIEFGSKMLDHLHILVSGKEDEAFPVSLRYKWVAEFVENRNLDNVTIYYHIDESPSPVSVDENGTVLDTDFQEYWVREFSKVSTGITHFVSSDKYGKVIADAMGIKWIPVDPEREIVKISATKIRENLYENFDFLSEVVKSHFVKKVAIVGPESTGKSTMVHMLSDQFKSPMVHEYGRTISEARENELSVEDFFDIMNGQQVLIDIAVENSNKPLVLIDTEAYTTYLFSKIYLKEYAEEIREYARNQDIDLYVVLAPTVEWVNDGWRVLNQKEREEFFDGIIKLLREDNRRFIIVDGVDYEQRLNYSRYSIQEYLNVLTN